MLNENALNKRLTAPSARLIGDVAKIDGDIMILGAGGKMGPTLCALAVNAVKAAGIKKRVFAVSRFTDRFAIDLLAESGVEAISADMLIPGALDKLPDCPNVIFMAGRKFGTTGQEHLTWATNAQLPVYVAERYKRSNIVVFSSGNIYPFASVAGGGNTEETGPAPVGEYAMSCLARERVFDHGAHAYGTKVVMFRLNFAVDLRYGVLHDIAAAVLSGQPLSLRAPLFNCIWQGDANEIAIRSLLHCENPVNVINVTGPETNSVRLVAERFGKIFGREPLFDSAEGEYSLFSNADKCVKLFGYPAVGIAEMMDMQARWLLSGGRTLGKPTHFEETGGKF